MTLIIFLKQSFRSLKKNWNTVTLFFLFLIAGTSLIVGLSAYLFNAYQLTVATAFKNGSQDGQVDQQVISWNGQDSPNDRTVVFTKDQRQKFKEIVGKPDWIESKDEDAFYNFLINNNGYLQSFLYKQGGEKFVNGHQKEFKDWIETFKWFNGSALAYYFKQIDIHPNWDVRTTDVIGGSAIDVSYVSNSGELKTYLPDEKRVVLTTFDERWIDYDHQQGNLPEETLFSPGDFTYHLKMSYQEYKTIDNPLFLLEKNFRDFNLNVRDEIEVSNTLLPVNAKKEKFTVVGDFVNAGKLVNFSNRITGAIPFTHFWETIQSKENYLDFPFYITMNLNNANNFLSRPQEIQKQIEARKIFESRVEPNQSLPEVIPRVAARYHAVVTFWQVNLPIILLSIFGVALLLFFVILFITKQLIENNKATLQFLKSMGLRNFELSSINMTLVLLPMILGFLIAIPGLFVIQNLFSFILEMQYPMVLNFWMWNYVTVFIFLGTVIFSFAVFFLTNLSVLKRHNILERKESKLVKRIKDGKIRNFIYNRVKSRTKIGLAIWAANLRKNLVTFAVLLVTFSVILFGVGFKGSIAHEGKLVGTTFLPFKSVSSVAAPLFSEQDLENENQSVFSQESIREEELINLENQWEITPEIINDPNPTQLIDILTSKLRTHYITSKTIDAIVGDDFNQFKKDFENLLWQSGQIPDPEKTIPQIMKVVDQLYANYQIFKLQLEKLYQYQGDFKFIFGRSVNPISVDNQEEESTIKNVGKILNLNVKINQRINNQIPPKIIHSFGLIDQNIKDVIGLNSNNSHRVEVKISQSLATKLKIYKTELQFVKPTFNFQLSLANDNSQTISIPARVMEIIRADFVQDAIYYSFDNLKSYLRTINPKPPGVLGEQLNQLLDPNNQKRIPNSYYTDGKIPNVLLNMTIPIVKGNGSNITNYVPNQDSGNLELQVMDFKIIGDNLVIETENYIYLVDRIIYIFIAITIIVSLLLTYLFLAENKQNILLFKSLGYSVREIATFLLIGYITAAIVAAGLAIGVSVLAISQLSDVFVTLFNAIIPFAFTPLYTFLFILLPILFIILIFFSLWIYIFLQDPKRALDA